MTQRRSWRFLDGVLLAGLCTLAVVATLQVWRDIFQMAIKDEESSQVLLAPAIAMWLFWVRRERARIGPSWTFWGPVAILASWGVHAYGLSKGHMVLQHLGALGAVVGGALTILGTQFVARFAPAFLSLLFVVPVPGFLRQKIAIPLQEATAAIAHWGLELFGFPVMRLGNVLNINGQDVAVAEACNGMRMVAALGLVGFAFVFSFPMRTGVRLLILALSPLVAIACNVIRLVPTVLLYGYADHDVATAFHDASGWAVLVVALGMLWVTLAMLRWLEIPVEPYAAAKQV